MPTNTRISKRQLNCITAALNLPEAIYTNLDLHSNVYEYVAFLDTEKAFDTVWHAGLLYKLHNLGIKGKVWRIIRHLYDGPTVQVSVNSSMSTKGSISKGAQQEGIMSGFLYLDNLDELLQLLVDSNCGVEVCFIACGNPVLCDDLTVLALFPSLLQIMLNISYDYSLKWHFKFQSDKLCVVLYSKQNAPPHTVFMLGDQPLKNEKCATHWGFRHGAKLKSKFRTEECCKKSLNSFYATLGYGVNPTGLNPMTYASLYKKS